MTSMMSQMWSKAMESSGDPFDPTLSLQKFCEVLKSFVSADQEVLGGAGGILWGRQSVSKAFEQSANSRPSGRYTLGDFFEVLWKPFDKLVSGIKSVPKGVKGSSEEMLPLHKRLLEVLLDEMQGTTLVAPHKPMPMDEWVLEFQHMVKTFCGASPSRELIEHVTSPYVPLLLPPCRGVIYVLLRTSVCKDLCGQTLAAEVGRKVLEEISGMRVEGPSAEMIEKGVREDLMGAMEMLALPRQVVGESSEVLVQGAPLKRRRTMSARSSLLATKTKEVRFALGNRVAFSRVPKTLEEAASLISELSQGLDLDKVCEDLGLSRYTLLRHAVHLDMALDSMVKEDIYERRLSGNFLGVTIATDESPPDTPRFAGLRFQITNFYLGFIEDKSRWEDFEDPPVRQTTILADICQCPGKSGPDLLRVLDKQLARLGLTQADVLSGTSDGGGENEGYRGMHASLEQHNPSYARRRCLPHISWRTSDMAIKAAEAFISDYKALASYLGDGVTWRRLRALATKPTEDGGLNLFADGSPACFEVFHRAPGGIVHGRPHSDLQFLSFLRGKEEVLAKLCAADMQQRDLAEATKKAVEALRLVEQNIFRSILCEILHRTHYLHFWTGVHPQVAAATSLEVLMDKAAEVILDMSIDNDVLARFGVTQEILEAKGWEPRTWVELAVLKVVDDPAMAPARLERASELHRVLADRASSHLSLIEANIMRSHWQAAGLLDKDAPRAQARAKVLLKHIDSTPPGNRSTFEQFLFEETDLWDSLVAFAGARPPVPLWKGRGRFEALFKWLASSFLVGPDHVLDCERVHARWQWFCASKRGLQLPALNAILKVTHQHINMIIQNKKQGDLMETNHIKREST